MGTRQAWSNRSRSLFRYGLAGCLPCILLLGACGGSSPPVDAPKVTPQPHESETGTADSNAEEAAQQEEAPKASSCGDGTCSSCGAGICPSGWYCDESAKGGAACGWLPQCVQQPSCACLSKVLGAGCSCSERDSGLHVTCK